MANPITPMATIYDLKPRFQSLLRPATRWLAGAGATANQVTAAALVLSCLVGACIAICPTERWPLFIVPPFLFLRMALNAIDGMLAREHGMRSNRGLVLNELGDVVADAALYLPFAIVPGMNAWLVVSLVVLSIVSEMAGVVVTQIGASRRYDGPLGKSDRAFLFGLIALLLATGVPSGTWLDALLAVAVGLSVVTTIRRARRGLREAQRIHS